MTLSLTPSFRSKSAMLGVLEVVDERAGENKLAVFKAHCSPERTIEINVLLLQYRYIS